MEKQSLQYAFDSRHGGEAIVQVVELEGNEPIIRVCFRHPFDDTKNVFIRMEREAAAEFGLEFCNAVGAIHAAENE